MSQTTVFGFLSDLRLLAYGVSAKEFRYAENMTSTPSAHELIHGGGVPNYTLRAIPMFIVAIIFELFVGLLRGKKLYRMNDFMTSIFLGSTMLVVSIWTKLATISAYCYIYKNFRLATLPMDSWYTWIGLFLGIDLGYYWMHRTAHTYHFMWAAHSVHHSGEDYNLATALRQGALQGATSWVFYLPLALAFHPGCYAGHQALNTLGQFWIHTKVIGDLGPLEYIFNTPMHHRMHHRPPGNCNYAALLIIWDRMFGTFKVEREQQEYYGLAKQYSTWDPVWANFEHARRVFVNVGGSNSFCKLFARRVKHPSVFKPMEVFGAIPYGAQSRWIMPYKAKREKYDPVLNHSIILFYCFGHFVVTLAATLGVLMSKDSFTSIQMALVSVYILFSMSCIAKLLDGERSLKLISLETTRILIFCAVQSSRIDFNMHKMGEESLGLVGSYYNGNYICATLIVSWLVCMVFGLFAKQHND